MTMMIIIGCSPKCEHAWEDERLQQYMIERPEVDGVFKCKQIRCGIRISDTVLTNTAVVDREWDLVRVSQ